MKKVTLLAGALLILAAPLYAYVQTGNVVNGPRSSRAQVQNHELPLNLTGARQIGRPGANPMPSGRSIDETTTQPVPEPGTMAMASMGLLALGAAIRRKRAR